MIAMSMISTYDEYRRDRIARAPGHSAPVHPLRRAMMRVLSRIGVGGVAVDDEGGQVDGRIFFLPRRTGALNDR